MAKKSKKKSRSADLEKRLTSKLEKARARRDDAEASAQKWKKRAKDLRKDVQGLRVELADVRRRLATAEAAVRDSRATAAPSTPARKAPATKTAAKRTAATKAVSTKAPSTEARAGADRPDDSWTVTALRAEARSRGITGWSRKTKAQLVAELRG